MTREQIIERVDRWFKPEGVPITASDRDAFMQDVAVLVSQSKHWAADAKFLEELRKKLIQR